MTMAGKLKEAFSKWDSERVFSMTGRVSIAICLVEGLILDRNWHHHMTLIILAHFFVVRMSLRLKKSPSGDVTPGGDGVGDCPAPPRV